MTGLCTKGGKPECYNCRLQGRCFYKHGGSRVSWWCIYCRNLTFFLRKEMILSKAPTSLIVCRRQEAKIPLKRIVKVRETQSHTKRDQVTLSVNNIKLLIITILNIWFFCWRITVMIQFSIWGTSLLLVTQRIALTGVEALVREGALISS